MKVKELLALLGKLPGDSVVKLEVGGTWLDARFVSEHEDEDDEDGEVHQVVLHPDEEHADEALMTRMEEALADSRRLHAAEDAELAPNPNMTVCDTIRNAKTVQDVIAHLVEEHDFNEFNPMEMSSFLAKHQAEIPAIGALGRAARDRIANAFGRFVAERMEREAKREDQQVRDAGQEPVGPDPQPGRSN